MRIGDPTLQCSGRAASNANPAADRSAMRTTGRASRDEVGSGYDSTGRGPVLSRYRVWLRYQEGTEGEVDLSHLVGKGAFSVWEAQGMTSAGQRARSEPRPAEL